MTIQRAGGTQPMRGATGPQKPTTGAMPEKPAAPAKAAARDAFQPTGGLERTVVRPGDSLARIAQRFKVPVEQLLALNPQLTEGPGRSKDGRTIFPGETVLLKAPVPQPKPPAAPAPNQATAPAAAAEDDALLSAETKEKLTDLATEGLEDNSMLVTAQTVGAGTLRSASMLTKGNRYLDLGADLIEGAETVSQHVQSAKVSAALALSNSSLSTKTAEGLASVFGRLTESVGAVSRALGKAAPVLSVIAAGYDTFKAFKATDGAPKRAAVANATLSIVGTAAGLGALAIAGTAAAVPLAIGAAAVATFQLVDTLAFDGKGTQWLGDKAAAIGSGLKRFFGFGEASPALAARAKAK